MGQSKIFVSGSAGETYAHCGICDGLFTHEEWDVRHHGHVEGCLSNSWNPCRCDIDYHDQCCPDCKE